MTKTTLRALVAASLMLTAGYASAATCEATVEGNDQMKYNTAEVVVDKSCKEFKVTLKHVGKMNKGSMGHNWVLTKSAEIGRASCRERV